ncbi:MAG: Xaa-Pro peptidase family protein [Candidatus Obscuribacterales bacterium]|nr:Xaa-Pro peptidase family protein [Candidatus Obscuribacterales bacterium]
MGMKKRIAKLQQALAKQKLDAFLVRVNEGDNQNVLYLSGFSGSTALLLISRKKAFIITDARYWLRVGGEAPDFTLVKVQRGQKVTDVVNDILKKLALPATCKIGYESALISVDVSQRWSKEIKGKLVPTVHVVERFRQYKDEHEIGLLRKACRSTSLVYKEVVPLIKPGLTENELAFEIDMRLRKHGAISNSFTSIVAGGPNAAVPHHATGNRRFKAGEPVIMDFGGLYPGGYCSDITRTAFVPGKKPHGRMIEIYNLVLAANKAAFKALKPGIKWREFDQIARDCINDGGYGEYFTHGLGHSLGLVAHDPYDYENDPFDIGMVVTDEPGIYIPDFGGVRIEDDVVVTASGAERLTNAPYWRF